MANRPGEDLLLVENLEVRYGEVQVLWGISFSARQSQVTCMIGPNGAGKTTTLKALAGVLPVKNGRVVFRGEEITRVPPHGRVTRRMSLVPEGRQLWPGMSVEDNLLMGCFIPELRKNAKASLPRIYDLFPRLKERRHQMAGTLSGGEQQMCAIGRGLMSEPQLLMLDEPTLGLAPILVDEIFAMVGDIARQGVTILLAAQNVNYTLHVSQYGYVMEVGKIALEGPPDMLANNDHVREAYLGG